MTIIRIATPSHCSRGKACVSGLSASTRFCMSTWGRSERTRCADISRLRLATAYCRRRRRSLSPSRHIEASAHGLGTVNTQVRCLFRRKAAAYFQTERYISCSRARMLFSSWVLIISWLHKEHTNKSPFCAQKRLLSGCSVGAARWLSNGIKPN